MRAMVSGQSPKVSSRTPTRLVRMPQSTLDVPEEETPSFSASAPRSAPARCAEEPRDLPQCGRAALLIGVSVLAAAWAGDTQAYPATRGLQWDVRVSSSAPSERSGEAGNIANRFAQAASSDAARLPQAVDQEHHGARTPTREPGNPTHDPLQSRQAQTQAHDEAAAEKSAPESGAAELRRSLLRERAERLDRDLLGVRRNPAPRLVPSGNQGEETRQAADGAAAELRKSMQQERERASRLEQDVATARRALEAQTAAAGKAKEEASRAAADMKQLLAHEHERADALADELSTTRAKVYAFEVQARKASEQVEKLKNSAADNHAAELDRSLQQEHERSSQLQQDLASAKRELEAQTALTAKANEEATRLKQIADDGAAELNQSLQQEHEKAEALARELSTAREQISQEALQTRKAEEQVEDLKKRVAESGAADLRSTLQQERERVEQLEQKLKLASREVETKTALLAKSNDEAGRLKQAAETGETKLKLLLQQEQERSETLSGELGTVRAKLSETEARQRNATAQADELKKAELHKVEQDRWGGEQQEEDLASERSQRASITQVAAAGPITPAAGTEADINKPVTVDRVSPIPSREARNDSDEGAAIEKLVARASALLGQGDIGSARIVLERAAESGSTKATFALAETYDPLILPKWGTFGTRGDVDKARELYGKAEAGGNKQAKQRLNALR
jgi:hypothetical protein